MCHFLLEVTTGGLYRLIKADIVKAPVAQDVSTAFSPPKWGDDAVASCSDIFAPKLKGQRHMNNRNLKAKVLRRTDVEKMIGLSRSTIYKMIADGDFPHPIKIGARAVGWLESDICQWLNERSGGRFTS